MTSELMLKVTVVLLVVSVASSVMLDVMLDALGETELMRIALNKHRVLKHPLIMAASVSHVLTKPAAAVSAVIAAVLWLMGA